jgi:hypothetical protein
MEMDEGPGDEDSDDDPAPIDPDFKTQKLKQFNSVSKHLYLLVFGYTDSTSSHQVNPEPAKGNNCFFNDSFF